MTMLPGRPGPGVADGLPTGLDRRRGRLQADARYGCCPVTNGRWFRVRRSQQTFAVHQLGIQNRRTCGTPDRVVAERDELVPEHRTGAQAAHRDGHSTVAVDVQRRLRTVRLVEGDDRLRRRPRALEWLPTAPSLLPRLDAGAQQPALGQCPGHRTGLTTRSPHAG